MLNTEDELFVSRTLLIVGTVALTLAGSLLAGSARVNALIVALGLCGAVATSLAFVLALFYRRRERDTQRWYYLHTDTPECYSRDVFTTPPSHRRSRCDTLPDGSRGVSPRASRATFLGA